MTAKYFGTWKGYATFVLSKRTFTLLPERFLTTYLKIIWDHICSWLYLVLSSHMGGVGFICILSGTNFRTH